jgi:hypothetical protein
MGVLENFYITALRIFNYPRGKADDLNFINRGSNPGNKAKQR